jgi:hypothetical protein
VKLQVASSPMQIHTNDRCDEKVLCNDRHGSPCIKREKPKRFSLNGFLAIEE